MLNTHQLDDGPLNGPRSFTSTTRPTSAGTGEPAATSLMTRDDAHYEVMLNPLKSGEIPLIPLAQNYVESASAAYLVSTGSPSTLLIFADPSAAQDAYYYYRLLNAPFGRSGNTWPYTQAWELFFLVAVQSSTKTGTKIQIGICNTAPFGTIDEASRFGLAIESWSTGGVAYVRLVRKLTTGSTLEVSGSIALTGADPLAALWLKNNADGSAELRVVSSSNFTTPPARPASATTTLPAGTYTLTAGTLYLTGKAFSATATDNSGYFTMLSAKYHIS